MISSLSKNLLLLLVLCWSAILYQCQTSSLSATQTVQMGDAMNNQNRYDEAIGYYESYLESAPSLGIYRNYEMESDVCRKLAHVYSTQGRYNRSLEYLEKAFRIDSEINKDQLKVTEDLRLIGVTHTYLGDYPEAIEFLNQSLERTEGMEASAKSVRKLAVADTYLSLANVNLALGNLNSTLDNADKALEIYDQIPSEFNGKIEAFLIKGNVATLLFLLEDAEKFIARSMELCQRNGLNTARQLQSLSEVQRLKGELEESLRTRLKSLEEAEKSRITPQIVWAHLRVGDAYGDLGDDQRARQYYRRAQQIQIESAGDTSSLQPSIQMRLGDVEQAQNFWNQAGSTLGVAITSLKLAQQMLNSGMIDSAGFYFSEAMKKFDEIENNEGLVRSMIGTVQCMIEQGNNDEALSLVNDALRRKNLADAEWQLWFQKGQALENLGQLDSAIEAYFNSIEIIEDVRGSLTIEEFRSSFFNDKTIVYDRLINGLIKKGGRINYQNEEMPAAQWALFINEKARSRTFLDMLGNKKINPKSSGDDELLGEEQSLRLKIQQLSIQIQKNELSGQSTARVRDELISAQSDYQDILQRIKLQNAIYASITSVEPPSLDEIQNAIADDTAIIEYWTSKEQTLAWVISSDFFEVKVLGVTREEIVRNIEGLRNAIQFNLQENLENALSRLYSDLIAPLESLTESYSSLSIVPHGPLHFLPFQALTNKNDRYLISEKNLFYSPSASIYQLISTRKEGEHEKMLSVALGDHQIGEHNPLPGTEYEVSQIAQFYQQYTPRYRQDNSESFFKEHANDYNLIHIATHGVLSERQPLYSYLLMTPTDQDDGRLTVNEIMDLNLDSKLITLSACETALGDLNNGDELVGLSRAFLYAGTSSVVVSLWTVDDVSTSLLMTKFHQFLNEGEKPHIALSMAQRELLQQNFSTSDSRGRELKWNDQLKQEIGIGNRFNRSPYYWAPFILIGDGS